MASLLIHQDIYKEDHPAIALQCIQLGALFPRALKKFLATATLKVLGIAASYDTDFALDALAFSTDRHVLLIIMGRKPQMMTVGKRVLSDQVLCNASYKKHGFNMDRIAAALHLDVEVPILEAFDIQHLKHARGSRAAILGAVSGNAEGKLERSTVLELFRDENSASSSTTKLALRAWASHRVASEFAASIKLVPAINTEILDSTVNAPHSIVLYLVLTLRPVGHRISGQVPPRCGSLGWSETNVREERRQRQLQLQNRLRGRRMHSIQESCPADRQ